MQVGAATDQSPCLSLTSKSYTNAIMFLSVLGTWNFSLNLKMGSSSLSALLQCKIEAECLQTVPYLTEETLKPWAPHWESSRQEVKSYHEYCTFNGPVSFSAQSFPTPIGTAKGLNEPSSTWTWSSQKLDLYLGIWVKKIYLPSTGFISWSLCSRLFSSSCLFISANKCPSRSS